MIQAELLALLDTPTTSPKEAEAPIQATPIQLPSGTLPAPVDLQSVMGRPITLAPAVIGGVLRRAQKMMLAGPSKAGKTFSLMELALCVAAGKPWMGLFCKQGRVLYLNMELDENSCLSRFQRIAAARKVSDISGLMIWNLRGYSFSFEELVEQIAEMVKAQGLLMVIVDPIYKVFTGSENDQEAVTQFCNTLDKIAKAGASVVYCHHHSKGAQGGKSSMDRASGSGVFARDVDALVDMVQVFASGDDEPIDPEGKGVTGWRVEFTLREFQPKPPLKVLFSYPLHTVCTDGRLDNAQPLTTQRAAGKAGGQTQSAKKMERQEQFKSAYRKYTESGNDAPSVTTMCELMGVQRRTIKRYANELGYRIAQGRIYELDSGQ